METKEIIRVIKEQREKREVRLNEAKKNISSDYVLAQLDFVTIENYEDSIETLKKIELQLIDLQNRIIERNK